MKKNELVSNLIKGCPVALLCTPEADGSMRMRPMIPPKQKFEGSLRFLIEATAVKFLGSRGTAPVSLGYVNPEAERFVSIAGTARVVDDQKAVAALWSEQFKAWFKNGKTDRNIAVLQVDVSRVESWDARQGGHTKLSFD